MRLTLSIVVGALAVIIGMAAIIRLRTLNKRLDEAPYDFTAAYWARNTFWLALLSEAALGAVFILVRTLL